MTDIPNLRRQDITAAADKRTECYLKYKAVRAAASKRWQEKNPYQPRRPERWAGVREFLEGCGFD